MPVFSMFEIGRIFSLISSMFTDFAYIRNTQSGTIFSRRSVISLQAAFEFAQTRIFPSVYSTISAMAATKVLVLPVPDVEIVHFFKLYKRS